MSIDELSVLERALIETICSHYALDLLPIVEIYNEVQSFDMLIKFIKIKNK